MNLLVPKLSPLQLAAYLVSLVVCFIFRGEVSPDISYAIDPATLVILGATYAAAKGIPKIIKGVQSSRALKKYKASAEGKAQAKIGEEAREDLDRGAFGKSTAEKNAAKLAGLQTLDAANKSTEANIKQAAAANPFGGPTSQENLKILADRRAGFIGQQSGDIERASDAQAAQQIAAAEGKVSDAAAQKMSMLQGQAAATTAQWEGGAEGVMAGVGMGADLHSAGAFSGGDAARAGAAGSRMTNVPVGSDPFTGAPGPQR